MNKFSAGLLAYRLKDGEPEVFIVHPGGPFFAKKDEGSWSIPKGLFESGEEPFAAAKREFEEETGFKSPEAGCIELGDIQRSDGKNIVAWAFEGDFDAAALTSNTFELEWPPRSGKKQELPEVDKGGWFSLAVASRKLQPEQVVFLERLANHLHAPFGLEAGTDEPRQGSLF